VQVDYKAAWAEYLNFIYTCGPAKNNNTFLITPGLHGKGLTPTWTDDDSAISSLTLAQERALILEYEVDDYIQHVRATLTTNLLLMTCFLQFHRNGAILRFIATLQQPSLLN